MVTNLKVYLQNIRKVAKKAVAQLQQERNMMMMMIDF